MQPTATPSKTVAKRSPLWSARRFSTRQYMFVLAGLLVLAGGILLFAATPSAPLSQPQAVVVDSAGNTYISNTGNNEVEKLTPSGGTSVVAGTGTAGLPTPGPAAASKLNGPTALAVDSAGDLYIADTGNNVVEKVTTGGALSIVAGIPGAPGVPAAQAIATNTHLYAPDGLAIDRAGNLYIANRGAPGGVANLVLVMSPSSGGYEQIFSGVDNASGLPIPGPSYGNSSKFNAPGALAVDKYDNLYIADTGNNVVEKIVPSNPGGTGGTLSIVAGIPGSPGVPAAQAIATQTHLRAPDGVAVDSAGDLYIANKGGLGGAANLVLVVNPTSGYEQIFSGVDTANGPPIPGPAYGNGSKFNAPAGLAVDKYNNLYIADTGNNVVEKIIPSNTGGTGGTLSIIAGAVTAPPPVITAPANLTPSNITTNSINYRFSPSTDSSTTAPPSYEIYRYVTSAGPNTAVPDSGSGVATSGEVIKLNPGTQYSFYVEAFDSASHVSTPSNTVVVTTLPSYITAPANFTASHVAANSFAYSFSPSLDEAGSKIAGYEIYKYVTSQGAGSAVLYATAGPTAINGSVVGLFPGRTYSFYVIAYSSAPVSYSDPSNTITLTTAAAPAATFAPGEQLSIPPGRRPMQYLHVCTVGPTIYITQGSPNCLPGGTYRYDYAPSVPGTVQNVPCLAVGATGTAATAAASERFVYVSRVQACPSGSTAVPLKLAPGEQFSAPPLRRPAQYLTICTTTTQPAITYITQGSPSCLLGDTLDGRYSASVPGTYYDVPCATVSGTLMRFAYVSSIEACPSGTSGILSSSAGALQPPNNVAVTHESTGANDPTVVSWVPASDRSQDTAYNFYDNGTKVGSLSVAQGQNPAGMSYGLVGAHILAGSAITIRAVSTTGKESADSNHAIVPVYVQAPGRLTITHRSSSANDYVSLSWAPASDYSRDVAYRIYVNNTLVQTLSVAQGQNPSGMGAGVFGLGVPQSGTSFTVRAVDASGHESPNSNTATY